MEKNALRDCGERDKAATNDEGTSEGRYRKENHVCGGGDSGETGLYEGVPIVSVSGDKVNHYSWILSKVARLLQATSMTYGEDRSQIALGESVDMLTDSPRAKGIQ